MYNMLEINNTQKDFPNNQTVISLFEEQVKKASDRIAVVFSNKILTYNQLNEQSNKLAHFLIKNYTIKPDTLVALCQERSHLILVSILAILKAGGAYVPIDPLYPDERIKYIVNDSSIKLILTNDIYHSKLQNLLCNTEILTIDNDYLKNNPSNAETTNPITELNSNNLAYVIYTSGTTGVPKGVMIEHKSVINRIHWMHQQFPIHDLDKILQKTPYAFDVAVWEFFWPILYGASIAFLPPEQHRDPVKIIETIEQESITVAHFVPSMFSMFLENLPDPTLCKSLRYVFCSGENLHLHYVRKFQQLLPFAKLHNLYGPTETTIDSLHYDCNNRMIDKIYIGKPIDNTTTYILDEDLKLVSPGDIGELYIGGVGLARGYLNKIELTNEKFVPNPFQTDDEKILDYNSRIYKTGDLARYALDGNIEYIGRNDFQVKINGHRIELEEIEHHLLAYEGIEQAVVVGHQGNNDISYLAAYYTSSNLLDEAAILNYLKSKIPLYSIPSSLRHLANLPLTSNGKLDRESLIVTQHNIAPRMIKTDDAEDKILQIFSKVLNMPKHTINMQQNFFDLGANSLILFQIKAELEKSLSVKLNIIDLFRYTNVTELARYVMDNNTALTKKHTNTLPTNHTEDVAIIGMSATFSGAKNIDEYWDNLLQGKESLTRVSKEDCKRYSVYGSEENNFIPVCGLIDGIENFDPEFWNISIKDAISLDPQIRKFIEHAWIALENSGYITDREKRKIGVFAGMNASNYNEAGKPSNLPSGDWDIHNMNSKDYLSTRVSYLLGLTGISLTISTACSTALISIIEACKNLILRTCDIALAGAVSIPMPYHLGYNYTEGLIFSEDGHCRPFDHEASGMVIGAGLGVIVLKRLNEAIEDKDNIIAVIKGYAANNDGNRKTGFTAPSMNGQTECILEAQRKAGVSSSSIEYVECHGTGTTLGDPIEIAALHDAFMYNSASSKYKSIIGSIKANIGHAGTASGMASIIKACKMLQNRIIPKQINFTKYNPHLKIDTTGFQIITENMPYDNDNILFRIAVNSMGIGGTNAHIILEEYKKIIKPTIDNDSQYHLVISAKTLNSYRTYCNKLVEFLEKNNALSLSDLEYSLMFRREHFNECKNYILCHSIEDAITKLKLEGCRKDVINRCLSNKEIAGFVGVADRAFIPNLPSYQFEKVKCWILKLEMDELLVATSEEGSMIIEEEHDALELQVGKIFCDILGYKKLSKYSSYFELGGDSITAILLIKQLAEEARIQIPLHIILQYDSIDKLCQYYRKKLDIGISKNIESGLI